jgi:hypothetical protein
MDTVVTVRPMPLSVFFCCRTLLRPFLSARLCTVDEVFALVNGQPGMPMLSISTVWIR